MDDTFTQFPARRASSLRSGLHTIGFVASFVFVLALVSGVFETNSVSPTLIAVEVVTVEKPSVVVAAEDVVEAAVVVDASI